MKTKEWFAGWFDSPYYHELYKNRDYTEAQLFMDNVVKHFDIKSDKKVLDLACGKGRHSIYLAKKDIQVTGLDLSRQSIQYADSLNIANTEFYIHDMRQPFRIRYYDYILNLFTSFGYFQTEREHVKSLSSMRKGIKKGGAIIIDFMNARKVKDNLVLSEVVNRENLSFDITRRVENNRIIKSIEFSDKGKDYYFEESVWGFELADFEKLTMMAGLTIQATYGNYNLDSYDEKSSPRLIMLLSHSI